MGSAPEIVAHGFTTPEAPRWRGNRLWFSDIFRGSIHTLQPGSRPRLEIQYEGPVSGLGFLPDGRLLFVSVDNRRVMRRERDGRIVRHADLAGLAVGPCNDMLVDPRGRAYVGSYGWIPEGPGPPQPLPSARLILVGADGSARHVGEPLLFPNGMALTPDGRRLIVAESFANQLSVFDVEGDGSLRGGRVWAKTPYESPDGICLDREGCIWAAMAFPGKALRMAEGGEVLQEIDPPEFPGMLAVALGGRDRRTLYMLCVPVEPRGTEEAQQALSKTTGSAIVAVDVDVPGV